MVELLVALFALIFLAFCVTAIALYGMSKDNDDVAKDAISSLTKLGLGSSKEPPSSNDDSE